MAIVTVPAEARRITDPAEIKAFLADHGLHYEVWPLEDRVDPAAPADDDPRGLRTRRSTSSRPAGASSRPM